MLTLEVFKKAIEGYFNFSKAIDRISECISGTQYGVNLIESDWFAAVCDILDAFLKANFNDNGVDLIYWWMFEDVDKVITIDKEISVDVTTIEDLWKYLIHHQREYFNV